MRGRLAFFQKRVNGQLSPYNVVLALGASIFYYSGAPGPMVEEGTKVLQITEDLDEASRQQEGGDPRGRGTLLAG